MALEAASTRARSRAASSSAEGEAARWAGCDGTATLLTVATGKWTLSDIVRELPAEDADEETADALRELAVPAEEVEQEDEQDLEFWGVALLMMK